MKSPSRLLDRKAAFKLPSFDSDIEPVALFMADAHLDVNTWANRPDLYGDSMWSFAYICRTAIGLQIPVFGAGDLIDVRKPPSAVIDFVRDEMDCLQANDCRFYYTQGQHELADPPWLSASHSWPTHIHQQTHFFDNFAVHGLDWTPPDRVKEEFAALPKVKAKDKAILMCHQVWEEFMGDVVACEASFTHVPYFRRVFTGDYHNCSRGWVFNASGKKLWYYSPGSTNMRAINENSVKYVYLLDSKGKLHNVRIPTRPVIAETIRDTDELETFRGQFSERLEDVKRWAERWHLPECVSKPLVYITFHEDVPDCWSQITDLVGTRGHLFSKQLVRDNEVVIEESDENDKALDRGLTSCLHLVIEKDDPRYGMLLRMLADDVTDPKLVLQAIRKERGLAEAV